MASLEMNDLKKIGLGLTGFGVFFTFLGVILVFDKGLIAMGNKFTVPHTEKMVVKLYGQIKAACPQRVLLCFLEKGIDFEVIHVDLDKLEQKTPEHLLRQPFGQVPAIEDGDLKLFESRAIARYYATKYADQGTDLLGKTLEERAIVEQWMEVEANYFNVLALPLVWNIVFKPKLGEPCDVVLIEELKVKFEKILDVYEDRLGTNRYLAGNEFTLADVAHMPGMRYLMNETTLSCMITSRENMNRWWNEISARPAWKKLMELAAY